MTRFTMADVLAAQRELSSRHLADFIRLGWPVIEPSIPYVHGRHIDVMCEHLEAVANGEIRRLIINVPPGTMKSTAVGVFFPMWLWGPRKRPSMRFVGISHEQSLGIRDNLKCRRLVSSEWYQRLWPEVRLTRDQNEKLNFENGATGFRLVATPSNITGKRGDIVLIDDPISVENANSEAEREKVNTWFMESLPTRMNNPENSAIVLVMQRVHERDPTGLLMSKNLGWEHLMLPMRYEPERRTRGEWRTQPGELLFPERFPEHVVDELEAQLGTYASAGQLQQRPTPREGGLFKRHWFKYAKVVPKGGTMCRAWDLAGTVKKVGNNPDWTVGVRMWRVGTDYYIDSVDRFQSSPGVVMKSIKARAEGDPSGTIRLPQDPGQAGKAQAETMIKELAGYSVKIVPVTGDKETRARPCAVQAEAGNIYLIENPDWNEKFLDEICTFPMGQHDDQVDATADAFNELSLGYQYDFNAWAS
jgi:predicted phage terminase large subunit-like protein